MGRVARSSDISIFQTVARAWQRFFGYDFFISYAWADGRSYAAALASRLSAKPFRLRCFIDDREMGGGERWVASIERALRRSSALLLVVSDGSLASKNVRDEILKFAKRGRQPLLLINFSGEVLQLPDDHPLAVPLSKRLQFPEASELLLVAGAPSTLALEYVAKAATFIHSRRIQQAVLAAITTVLVVLAGTAVAFYASSITANTLNRASAVAAAAQNERDRGQISDYLPLVRAASTVALTAETRAQLLDGLLRWPRLEAEQLLTFNYPLYFGISTRTNSIVAADATKVHELQLPSFVRTHTPKVLDGVQVDSVTMSNDQTSLWLGGDDGGVRRFSLLDATTKTVLPSTGGAIKTIAEVDDNWLLIGRHVGSDATICVVATANGAVQSCVTLIGISPWQMSLFESGHRAAVLDDGDGGIRTLHIVIDGGPTPTIIADPATQRAPGSPPIRAFAVNPNGKRWVIADENTITVAARPDEATARTESFDGRIVAVAISKDASLAAVALEHGGLAVINLQYTNRRALIPTVGPNSGGLLQFSDDASSLYYVDASGLMTQWDLRRDSRIVASYEAPAPIVAAGPRPSGGFTILIGGAGDCSKGTDVTVSPVGTTNLFDIRAPVFSPSGAHFAFFAGGRLQIGRPCQAVAPIDIPGLNSADIVDLAFAGESGIWILDSNNQLGLVGLDGRIERAFAMLPRSDSVFTDGRAVPGADPIRAIAYSGARDEVLALRNDGTTSMVRPWSMWRTLISPARWSHVFVPAGSDWFQFELIDRHLPFGFGRGFARIVPSGRIGIEAVDNTLNLVALDKYDVAPGASLRSGQQFGSNIDAVAGGADRDPIFVLYHLDGSASLELAAIDRESLLAMPTTISVSLDAGRTSAAMVLDQASEHLLIYDGTKSYRIVNSTIASWKQTLDRIAVLPLPETESRLYGFDFKLLPEWQTPAR